MSIQHCERNIYLFIYCQEEGYFLLKKQTNKTSFGLRAEAWVLMERHAQISGQEGLHVEFRFSGDWF